MTDVYSCHTKNCLRIMLSRETLCTLQDDFFTLFPYNKSKGSKISEKRENYIIKTFIKVQDTLSLFC